LQPAGSRLKEICTLLARTAGSQLDADFEKYAASTLLNR
jgi:hypothetical protein